MNFETAYNIGECFRTQSFDGGQNYEGLAKAAMPWYARGMKLNPHDGYNYLRYGMCLDWLDNMMRRAVFQPCRRVRPQRLLTAANVGCITFRSEITPPPAVAGTVIAAGVDWKRHGQLLSGHR